MFNPECETAEAPGGASAVEDGSERVLVPDVKGEGDRPARRALRVGPDHAERVLARVKVPE